MNNKSALFSLVLAIAVAVFATLISVQSGFEGGLIFFLLLSAGVFFFSWCIFELFIFRRLRSVYRELLMVKEIHKTMSARSGARAAGDLIENIQEQIRDWAKERKEETERLKKLETHRREFLGNVSHELKTPIFNIQGYVNTLLDGAIEDGRVNRDYLMRAEKNIERMISIVEDLSAITQLETGELQLEMEEFDILQLIQEIVEAQELNARSKNISLTLLDTPPKSVMVFADKFRIRQVLTNLIVNSIKYGKQDGKTELRCNDAVDKVLIEVSDNGIGIAREHISRLFERFYRVDKSRSREQGGTGLGLAIVKHIIEAHHQSINVMSTEGAGSVFSFTLSKEK